LRSGNNRIPSLAGRNDGQIRRNVATRHKNTEEDESK
jgi:hypothetical protein